MSDKPASEVAAEILSGAGIDDDALLSLVGALHRERRFDLARKILDKRSAAGRTPADAKLRRKFIQKRALSTYKDPHLAVGRQLRDALKILQGLHDLATTEDQETLGQAGAIYKRMWEHTGVTRHLETAAAMYSRGYEAGVKSDYGYTSINAAFVLDLLADIEAPDDQLAQPLAASAQRRREEATKIRQAIVAALTPLDADPGLKALGAEWWFLVTLGEAHFGLGAFEQATVWFRRAAELTEVPDWERESTARQVATLFRLMERAETRAGRLLGERAQPTLSVLLGGVETAVASVVRGRVGLALSGGGFRASLYHIGVLARLAEHDLLRHIEVLSCVSGGSIVGAHYYLEVRHLLQTTPDGKIKRDDYVQIVERVATRFLEGVQRNVRTRIAAEWLTNVRMIFWPHYSRTKRAGELFESEIYARVDDGGGDKPRWLNELKIVPHGESADFRPKDHNWRRAAKVPVLVLNATTLNTGHNWQFTATWMGEPPARSDSDIDSNYRLRRMYYTQAPEKYRQIRLGDAVAASACVPGLFEPLPLADLYERHPSVDEEAKVRPVVRLVDGGVYDNQGVSALLEQNCSVLLVSDASGQMADQDFPGNGLLAVPLRANSILQARVRVSQFEDLDGLRRSGLLKGLMFVHLKKGLDTRLVDWIACPDPSMSGTGDPLCSYGVPQVIQRRLAAIRTDLDSFSEVEAYALMTSGYLVTAEALGQDILGFPVADAQRGNWDFLKIQPLMTLEKGTHVQKQLQVAEKLAFKVWFLMRRLQIGLGVFVLAAVVILLVTFHLWWSHELFTLKPTIGTVLLSLLATGASLLGLGVVLKVTDYKKTIQQILIGLGMATLGFLFARLHLILFDRWFLHHGRIDKVAAKKAS